MGIMSNEKLDKVLDRSHYRVDKGVMWMDKEYPGWHHKVNLDTLDMDSCCDCVVSQMAGSYGSAEFRGIDEVEHVFQPDVDSMDGEEDDQYDEDEIHQIIVDCLNQVWSAKIEELRKQ